MRMSDALANKLKESTYADDLIWRSIGEANQNTPTT